MILASGSSPSSRRAARKAPAKSVEPNGILFSKALKPLLIDSLVGVPDLAKTTGSTSQASKQTVAFSDRDSTMDRATSIESVRKSPLCEADVSTITANLCDCTAGNSLVGTKLKAKWVCPSLWQVIIRLVASAHVSGELTSNNPIPKIEETDAETKRFWNADNLLLFIEIRSEQARMGKLTRMGMRKSVTKATNDKFWLIQNLCRRNKIANSILIVFLKGSWSYKKNHQITIIATVREGFPVASKNHKQFSIHLAHSFWKISVGMSVFSSNPSRGPFVAQQKGSVAYYPP
jgi:hypothetical protein